MDHKKIEKKWQDYWYSNGIFHATDMSDKPKYYSLVEFPYPSGSGLHVGHVRSYTAHDALARMMRMQGYNVLFPMGFDAFGSPAEQYAIKNHILLHYNKTVRAINSSNGSKGSPGSRENRKIVGSIHNMIDNPCGRFRIRKFPQNIVPNIL